MDTFQAILVAVVQGLTELFPVSSLGHAVLVPRLLGWSIDERNEAYLPFLVTLHVGTAVALLLYFWREWLALLMSLLPSGNREQRRLLMLLVVGTLPAGLLGLLLEKRLATVFGDVQAVAIFLILNGVMLLLGEFLRRRARQQKLSELQFWQAAAIGTTQAIALLPGFSRSGATMIGGLLVGLSHESAARFSFLLATPIIGAAALLEVPKLLNPNLRGSLGPAVVGGVIAGALAYASTWILMRYFRRTEVNSLVPFGLYCILFGIVARLATG